MCVELTVDGVQNSHCCVVGLRSPLSLYTVSHWSAPADKTSAAGSGPHC